MQHLVGQRTLARIDDAPVTDAARVARLAAAQRIEHRAVELDCVAVHGEHCRFAGLEVRVVVIQAPGHALAYHQGISSTRGSVPSDVRSGRSGIAGVGLTEAEASAVYTAKSLKHKYNVS